MFNNVSFTAVAIAALVGTLMTLFFAYVPRVRVWYAALPTETASLYKLGLLILTEAILGGLSFIPGIIILQPPFTWPTAIAVAVALILSNQPVASLLPATKDVREAMAKRLSIMLHRG